MISYRGTDQPEAELAQVDLPISLSGPYQPAVGCASAHRLRATGAFRLATVLCSILIPISCAADTPASSNADWLTLSPTRTKREHYVIPAAELPSRDSAPMLFYGEIMNGSHPRWHQYERALRDHPDVLSCLTQSDVDTASVDLLRFDWVGPRDQPDIDVCLFRVLTALREPTVMADWFRYSGFKVAVFNDPTPSAPPSDHEPRQGFDATIVTGAFRDLRPNWFYSITGYDPAHSYTCSVRFSSNLRLSGVSCIGNVE